jgi:polyketide cyclase/dehydrase/lipid transport protein
MKGRLSCTVQRSPDEVFDFLADIRNERAWNPRVVRIDKTSSGPLAAGSRFRGRYKGLGLLDTELVEYDRPQRLGFRSTGPRMRIAGTFVLTETAGGTGIDLTADLEPQGVFRILAPLMAPVIRKQNEAAAVRLERALSQGG